MGQKNFKIIWTPVPLNARKGVLQFSKKLGTLTEVQEAFLKIITPLLPSYFEIFGAISKIKESNLIRLSSTIDLVVNSEAISYLLLFDAFCYHSKCSMLLDLFTIQSNGKNSGGPIILLPTVILFLF